MTNTHDVDHPDHYTSHPAGIECIQVTEHMNFCRGNAIKYIWRAGSKDNEVQDLLKARWYITRELKRLGYDEDADDTDDGADDTTTRSGYVTTWHKPGGPCRCRCCKRGECQCNDTLVCCCGQCKRWREYGYIYDDFDNLSCDCYSADYPCGSAGCDVCNEGVDIDDDDDDYIDDDDDDYISDFWDWVSEWGCDCDVCNRGVDIDEP